MSISGPDLDQLIALDTRYQLGLGNKELGEYQPIVAQAFDAWNAVEALYEQRAPLVPKRHWESPSPTKNSLGAWYVRTNITGAGAGALHGRTVAVKDNVAVAGVPMMNGSRTLEGYVPVRDATVVKRLLDAGATIAGKSVCEDLCFSGASFTSQPGPVRNPWDRTRIAGGSSSGSAALVASGEVDLAVGGDQGGSVRIPSAFCGIVGHKPTRGLVPYTGAFPIEQTIDHLGPITRTVRDAATMLAVMAGADGLDSRQPNVIQSVDYLAALNLPASGLRVGVVTEGFGTAGSDPLVDQAVFAAIDRLSDIGLQCKRISIPWHRDGAALWNVIATEGAVAQMLDGNAYGLNKISQYEPELMAYFGRQWRQRASEMSKTLKVTALIGRHALDHGYGQHYGMAQNLAFDLRAAYDAALAAVDVLVMPTLPYTAQRIPADDVSLGEYLGAALSMIGNTAPFNISGHPACSVPAGLVDGLPTAMMIIGRQFDDATVLRVAHAFENAVGGFPSPRKSAS